SQGSTFACDVASGVPATVVQSPKHGTVKIIEWRTTEFGGEFDPQSRCQIVSEKFQKYAQAGTLKYFTTGSVDRTPVICAVASQNDPCNRESMLYTLKKGSDAGETLKQLLDVRSGASGTALNETNSRLYIDFDQIVEAKAQEGQTAASTETESAESDETMPLF
ncbi:MAG: COP23 domain-containing protein, partial [Cyanobacteria bacterium J06600_6]